MNEPTSSLPSGVVDPTEYVTDAWLAFVRNPNHDVGPLRDEIEAMLYRLLYPRTLGGFFDGFFDYIVRETVLLTLSRFLADNKKLITATQSGNRGDTNAQLMGSIWLALQATMWRNRSLVTRSNAATAPAYAERESQALAELRQTTAKLGVRAAT